MKKGRTALALPLLTLGFFVCAGFFVPVHSVLALDATPAPAPTPTKTSTTFTQLQIDTAKSLTQAMKPFVDSGGDKSKLPTGSGITCTDNTGFLTSVTNVSYSTTCTQNGVSVNCEKSLGESGTNAACSATDSKGNQIGDTVADIATDSILDPSLKQTVHEDGSITTESTGGNCSLYNGNLSSCLGDIMTSLISGILWIILGMVAGILGLANYLLGWSTYITVFQFGNLVGNSAGLLAAWGVMRDVANIILLFGFIFLGVSTILNLPHSEYTAKKAVPALIIFALLLNFSLFAVEAVIDVSNAVATSIYVQATGGNGICDSTEGVGAIDSGTMTVDCAIRKGIGGQVMTMSGITSIYDFSKTNGAQSFEKEGGSTVVIYTGLIIFAIITALVLFAAAIMLIIRAVVLAFLMVTAPIGFAGMAIPPLHEMAQKWWKELISQAIFAPVYFLLALVSLKVMGGVMNALGNKDGVSGGNLAAIFSASVEGGKASNITIVMTFALIIGFMLAALIFAKSSSAHGSGMAITGAGKMAFGTLGFVGRQTLGRGASASAEYMRRNGLASGRFGSRVRSGLISTSKSSFDGRAASIGGKKLSDVTGSLGTAQKGGYQEVVHAKQKKHEEYADTLKTVHSEADKKKSKDLYETLHNAETNKGKTIKKFKKDIDDSEKAIKKQELENETNLVTKQAVIDSRQGEIATLQTTIDTKTAEQITAQTNGDTTRVQELNSELANDSRKMASLKTQLTQDVAEYDRTKTGGEASLQESKELKKIFEKELESFVQNENQYIKQKENELRVFDPKRHYAYTLEKNTVLDIPGNILTGSSRDARHHAAEGMLKKLGQNDVEKLTDLLNKTSKTSGHTPTASPSPDAVHP